MSDTATEAVVPTRRKVKPLPPRGFLEECFNYNPETGELIWKERPREHFKSERGYKIFNTRFSGTIAACPHSGGYLCIHLTFSENLSVQFVHRIAIRLSGIDLPDGKMVDHINGNRTDNRLCNLRVVDMHQNACNSLLTGGKKLVNGHLPRGVVPSSSFGKFSSRIRHRGMAITLGTFLTPEEARAAYEAKAIELRGEYHKS